MIMTKLKAGALALGVTTMLVVPPLLAYQGEKAAKPDQAGRREAGGKTVAKIATPPTASGPGSVTVNEAIGELRSSMARMA